jgi:hypothetical protein
MQKVLFPTLVIGIATLLVITILLSGNCQTDYVIPTNGSGGTNYISSKSIYNTDYKPPIVDITSPEDKSKAVGTVVISGTAVDEPSQWGDASGIDVLQYSINDGTYIEITNFSEGTWNFEIDAETLDKGQFHTIKVMVTDGAGNSNFDSLELFSSGWVPIPNPPETLHNGDGLPDRVSMTMALDGPIIVWSEPTFFVNNAVYAKQYKDGAWTLLGDGSLAGSMFNSTSRADVTMHGATPYVSYCQMLPFGIRVKAYSGGSWSDVGGEIKKYDRDLSFPMMSTIVSDGTTPYIAWIEPDETSGLLNQLFVKRFTGTDWEFAGDGSSLAAAVLADVGVSNIKPSIAFRGDVPYIAWVEKSVTFNDAVFVKKWNEGNSTWDDVGLAGFVVSVDELNNVLLKTTHPMLAVNNDTVYVALIQYNGAINEIQVRELNDVGYWTKVGEGLNIGGAAQLTPPSLVFYNDIPYVAWVEYGYGEANMLYVKRYDSDTEAWVSLGNEEISNDFGDPVYPTIALDESGIPYVTWLESKGEILDGENVIYAKKYIGVH